MKRLLMTVRAMAAGMVSHRRLGRAVASGTAAMMFLSSCSTAVIATSGLRSFGTEDAAAGSACATPEGKIWRFAVVNRSSYAVPTSATLTITDLTRGWEMKRLSPKQFSVDVGGTYFDEYQFSQVDPKSDALQVMGRYVLRGAKPDEWSNAHERAISSIEPMVGVDPGTDYFEFQDGKITRLVLRDQWKGEAPSGKLSASVGVPDYVGKIIPVSAKFTINPVTNYEIRRFKEQIAYNGRATGLAYFLSVLASKGTSFVEAWKRLPPDFEDGNPAANRNGVPYSDAYAYWWGGKIGKVTASFICENSKSIEAKSEVPRQEDLSTTFAWPDNEYFTGDVCRGKLRYTFAAEGKQPLIIESDTFTLVPFKKSDPKFLLAVQTQQAQAGGGGGGGAVAQPAPTVTSLSSTSGGGLGTTITITGTDFRAGATVKFGAGAALGTGVTVNSATSITVTLPTLAAGAHAVVVTNTDATTGTSPTNYTVTAPTITGIAPNNGAVGTSITITGTNLRAGATVKVGGVAATVTATTVPTSITATVPNGLAAAAQDVTVTNTDTTTTAVPGTFTVNAGGGPTITGVSPTTWAPENLPIFTGTPWTITGTNFQAGATVSVNGTNVTVDSVTATTITGTYTTGVTPGAGLSVEVTSGGVTVPAGTTITVTP